MGEYKISSVEKQPNNTSRREILVEDEPEDVIALAKKALSASKQAASLVEESELVGTNIDSSSSSSSEE